MHWQSGPGSAGERYSDAKRKLMIASRRSPYSVGTTLDRRTWLVGALAGAAYASLGAAKPDVLASLLQRNHALRPDFGGGFANHVSMGLYSLRALGADAAQL